MSAASKPLHDGRDQTLPADYQKQSVQTLATTFDKTGGSFERVRHENAAPSSGKPAIMFHHALSLPVNNPQAVQMLHTLDDLQQSRSQFRGGRNVVLCQRLAEPNSGSGRFSSVLELYLSASLGLGGRRGAGRAGQSVG